MKKVLCFLLLWMMVELSACKDYRTAVPLASVGFNIYLNSYDLDLTVGRSKVFKGYNTGYLGTIVYRYGQEDFVAYDIACPYDYVHGCSIAYVDSTHNMRCQSCCETKYNLMTGFPEKGSVHRYALRTYTVTKVNDFTYLVSN